MLGERIKGQAVVRVTGCACVSVTVLKRLCTLAGIKIQ